jgi:hypothetical protein
MLTAHLDLGSAVHPLALSLMHEVIAFRLRAGSLASLRNREHVRVFSAYLSAFVDCDLQSHRLFHTCAAQLITSSPR